MPPKEAHSKQSQKNSSEAKQDKKMVVVEEDSFSLLDVTPTQSLVADTQPDVDGQQKLNIVKNVAMKKVVVLEQAIADVDLEDSSFSEEYYEENSESEESDKVFGFLEPPSKFAIFDLSVLEEGGEEEDDEEEKQKEEPKKVYQIEMEDDENYFQVISDEGQDVASEVTQSVKYYSDNESVTPTTGDIGHFVNPLTGGSVEQITAEQEKHKK